MREQSLVAECFSRKWIRQATVKLFLLFFCEPTVWFLGLVEAGKERALGLEERWFLSAWFLPWIYYSFPYQSNFSKLFQQVYPKPFFTDRSFVKFTRTLQLNACTLETLGSALTPRDYSILRTTINRPKSALLAALSHFFNTEMRQRTEMSLPIICGAIPKDHLISIEPPVWTVRQWSRRAEKKQHYIWWLSERLLLHDELRKLSFSSQHFSAISNAVLALSNEVFFFVLDILLFSFKKSFFPQFLITERARSGPSKATLENIYIKRTKVLSLQWPTKRNKPWATKK